MDRFVSNLNINCNVSPRIASSYGGVSELPVLTPVEGVGVALAGGDYGVQAALAQSITVDTSPSS